MENGKGQVIHRSTVTATRVQKYSPCQRGYHRSMDQRKSMKFGIGLAHAMLEIGSWFA